MAEQADRPIAKAPTGRLAMSAVAAATVAAILAADQITKTLAIRHLEGRPARHVIWTLQWNFSLNSGVAFGLGGGLGALVTPVAVAVVVLVVIMTRSLTGWASGAGVGLVVGGAIGNLIDRLVRSFDGSVVDFIDLQWWPIFNIADAAIVAGGLLLALSVARQPTE